jgi:hypothetical protein
VQYLRTAPDDEAGPRLAEAARGRPPRTELREHLPEPATSLRSAPRLDRLFGQFPTSSSASQRQAKRPAFSSASTTCTGRPALDPPALPAPDARRLRDARLLVVGTFRTEEVDRSRPLFDVLAELARGQQEQRLTLSRLSPDETSSLVASLSGATPAAALVRAIHQQTEGNPFFVQEVVRHLQGQTNGLAGAGLRPEDWGLSEGVREVTGRRLSRLASRREAPQIRRPRRRPAPLPAPWRARKHRHPCWRRRPGDNAAWQTGCYAARATH